MAIMCVACDWPAPTLLSEHGTVRYWRCLCGQWLISEANTVTAAPGGSDFQAVPVRPR